MKTYNIMMIGQLTHFSIYKVEQPGAKKNGNPVDTETKFLMPTTLIPNHNWEVNKGKLY